MKQIEAQDFLFYYNPNLEELIVSSGLKFTNRLNDGFKVDLITIHTDFQVNMLGFKLIMSAGRNVLSTKDLDKIDLFFTGDKLEHLYISKAKDYNIIDSIRIFNEGEQYFVVKNKPQFTREAIQQMSLCNETIKIETRNNEFDYKLDVNEEILLFLNSVFKID